jgi:hypothetical protein
MATLDLLQCEAIAARERPWTCKLYNTTTQGIVIFTGRGLTEPVEKIEVKGANMAETSTLTDWETVRKEVADFLALSFNWAWTAYRPINEKYVLFNPIKATAYLVPIYDDKGDIIAYDGFDKNDKQLLEYTPDQAKNLILNRGIQINFR